MNLWDFWLGFVIGVITAYILVFGVTRFKERRDSRTWLSRHALIEEEQRKQLALFDDVDFFDRNKKAYEAETKLALGVTRESRGYGLMVDQCNILNPDPRGLGYYCVRHKSHINHVDPKVRRHGYAGVFWD